ncbi:hypothetical protein MK079_03080 [Candidatus Gracilibacteria bacterium]|nr:hypothetical protein [Candidatus Gracilibacteria bacterium]
MKYHYMPHSAKGFLIGIVGVIVSLFLEWGGDKSANITWNAFHGLSAYMGYIILILCILSICILFSQKNKQKFKLYTNIQWNDIRILWGIALVSCIAPISQIAFQKGLNTYSSAIFTGSGIPLLLSSGVVLCISTFFLQKYWRNISKRTLSNESSNTGESRNETCQ